jgi:hypothetical protein
LGLITPYIQAYDALLASFAQRSRYELLQEAHRRVRGELGGSSLRSIEEIIRQERQALESFQLGWIWAIA